ncbi:MAG: hypothetical protein IJW28_04290 [Clostridia bacterium]|nr:hypothetical protein [Clostridia bacterium]
MGYTGDMKQYLKQIITDCLPPSEIEKYELNRIGLYSVNNKNVREWRPELADSSHLYGHEKCTPKRYGIQTSHDPNVFMPIYFRHYDGTVNGSLDKIIANTALNFYPTPLQAYGAINEDMPSSKIGVATIDLNHLKEAETNEGVESIRLDFLLHSLGEHHEIESYMDFQKLLENGNLEKVLTPRAIVQLGLSSIFIPNAIGETDANSRNIILLKDKESGKYDIVVRIDAEANTYLNDRMNERSGKKKLPKGIFMPNEELDDYLKTIKSRDVRVDWEMFCGFTLLAREATSRTNIDNAVTKSYMKNSGKLMQDPFMRPSPYALSYDSDSFYAFSSATIDRSKRYFDRTMEALGSVRAIPPFAEGSKKYDIGHVEDAKLKRLAQKRFDDKGRSLDG